MRISHIPMVSKGLFKVLWLLHVLLNVTDGCFKTNWVTLSRDLTHLVGCCCILGENPKPARITDALGKQEEHKQTNKNLIRQTKTLLKEEEIHQKPRLRPGSSPGWSFVCLDFFQFSVDFWQTQAFSPLRSRRGRKVRRTSINSGCVPNDKLHTRWISILR